MENFRKNIDNIVNTVVVTLIVLKALSLLQWSWVLIAAIFVGWHLFQAVLVGIRLGYRKVKRLIRSCLNYEGS